MARLATKMQTTTMKVFLGIKSPNEFFRAIVDQLNEWVSFIPNLFHSLAAKFDEVFPPETRAHFAAVAAQWAAVAAGVIAICLFCFCCFPAIICCFSAINCCFSAIISCIVYVVVKIWNVICAVFGRCYGGRQLMMKAPGRAGNMYIPRIGFESNPASYFRGLRAGSLPSSFTFVS